MTVVIGTAGHIDHGKTSLLRALTGIDADRLPEERRRGMTIDVGYAHLELPDGSLFDFVDVPGHDRLVGNMLVGAGEVDAALLVVAVDDGPRAQTLEHLELLDALGLREGIAVVTKIDLVDEARVVEVVEAVRRLLARTTLAGSPVLAVSSSRGDGLDELRAALVALRDRKLGQTGTPDDAATGEPVRLAIDRVFSVKGRGVVVTGSLRGGRLARGASLRLEPAGRTARARELQVHGAPVDAVTGGGRVALNLAGVEAADVARGQVLTDDPTVRSTDRLTAILKRPAGLDTRESAPRWPPPAGAILRLHLGTDAVEATPGRGRSDAVDLPAGRRVATLRLVRPIAAAVGDPFVLRVPSPAATAAGGIVIDVAPPIGVSRRRATPEALDALATAWLAGDAAAVLAARVRLHGLVPRADGDAAPPWGRLVGGWILAEEEAATLDAEAIRLVDAHHEAEPLAAGMPLAGLRRALARSLRRRVTTDERTAGAVADGLVDALVAAGRLARSGDVVRDPGRSSGTLPRDVLGAMDRLEAALAVVAPPPFGEAARVARCPAEGVRALEASGRIVRVEPDLAWAGSTYRELEALAVRLADPGPLTPAGLRDATGTSRKYVMALLEDLDRRGVLRRTPAGHVRGPRAPR
jgi:selenocysteine-specific elongation factor